VRICFVDEQFAVNVIDFQPPALAIGFVLMAPAITGSPATMDAPRKLALIAPLTQASAVTKNICCHGANVTNPVAPVSVNLHSSGVCPIDIGRMCREILKYR
jgi:hypothetical protein